MHFQKVHSLYGTGSFVGTTYLDKNPSDMTQKVIFHFFFIKT
jgi:hypothetical protein